jgi:hypothetical protein
MEREKVEQAVIRCIQQVRALGGYREVVVTSDTVPLKDLPDFDSPNGVEVTVMLDAQLGGRLPKDAVSVFTSEDGERPLSVREIAKRICGP